MSSKVAILMSTYNGATYLEEQILSILIQTYKDWHLYIRDDGSSDSTIHLIENFERKYPKVTLLRDDVKHRGVKGSFRYLLEKCEADFYMFCDQDDVWMEDKIETSLKVLESIGDKENPILVVTDLEVVDENLKSLTNSMWIQDKINNIVDDPSFLIVAPMYTGCTMMFNQATKECVLHGKDSPHIIHDQLVALNVYKKNGTIKAIHRPLIKYRQHGHNVIGAQQTRTVNPMKLLKGALTYYKNTQPILEVSFPYYMYKKLMRFFKRF